MSLRVLFCHLSVVPCGLSYWPCHRFACSSLYSAIWPWCTSLFYLVFHVQQLFVSTGSGSVVGFLQKKKNWHYIHQPSLLKNGQIIVNWAFRTWKLLKVLSPWRQNAAFEEINKLVEEMAPAQQRLWSLW